jgi:hypothetical protein
MRRISNVKVGVPRWWNHDAQTKIRQAVDNLILLQHSNRRSHFLQNEERILLGPRRLAVKCPRSVVVTVLISDK